LDVTAAELVIVTFFDVSAVALADADAAAEADAAEEVFVF
jgi:hypothetical protein